MRGTCPGRRSATVYLSFALEAAPGNTGLQPVSQTNTMSVSRGGGGIPSFNGFNDLRVLQIDGLLRNTGSETGSPSLGWWQWEPAHEIAPVQERGEASELVAIELTRLVARYRQGPTPDDAKGVDAGIEIAFDPRDIENREQYGDKESTASSYDSTANGLRSAAEEEDSPTIWFLWDSGVSIYEDETSGAGGGSDQNHQAPVMKNFRREFGAGPVFDRHDRCFINAELQKLDPDDDLGEYQLLYSFTFYWNDFEMPDGSHI